MSPKRSNEQAVVMLRQRLPKFRGDVEKMKWILDTLTMRKKNARRVHAFKLYWGLSGEKPYTLQAIADRFDVTREAIRQMCDTVEEQLRKSQLWDRDP